MIVLASRSASRQAMLAAAGVSFVPRHAAVDERALEAALAGEPLGTIALVLAEAKARAISRGEPGVVVLGSDSLVEVDGRRFDKPASRDEAAAHLAAFSGRAMALHSAAALVRDGPVAWTGGAVARLTVRALSDAFVANYLDAEWPAIAACAGAFRIEGRGAQLFEAIDGDYFTVLGMPLLQVLAALRDLGELAE